MTTRLYKRLADGVLMVKDLSETQLNGRDAYNNALDFWYSEGWSEEVPG